MELLLENVSKKYGNKYALKNLSVSFTNGVYGILGANGAGKTTLTFRILDGIICKILPLFIMNFIIYYHYKDS